jgi:hypothetical protein
LNAVPEKYVPEKIKVHHYQALKWAANQGGKENRDECKNTKTSGGWSYRRQKKTWRERTHFTSTTMKTIDIVTYTHMFMEGVGFKVSLLDNYLCTHVAPRA